MEMHLRGGAHLQRLFQSDLGPTSADVDSLDVENMAVCCHDGGPRHIRPGMSALVHRPLATHRAATRTDARMIGRTAQSFVIASPPPCGFGRRALPDDEGSRSHRRESSPAADAIMGPG